MKSIFTPRLLRLLWLLALSFFIAIWLIPLSIAVTRLAGLVLLAGVWLGLLGLIWQLRPLRLGWLGISALCAVFLVMPARRNSDVTALRDAYVAGLCRYEGVTYYWGGESPKGIDCSGLIRRGLIDSLFLSGIRTLDAGLVRHAGWLWWHDCTARDLGEGHGLTTHLSDTQSLNVLDCSKLLAGDLAVTRRGVHIMAYLGDNRWIEADPGIGRVVIVSVPSRENPWFDEPMNLVRWNILQR